MPVRYTFIRQQQEAYPVTILCEVMQVNRSGYYRFLKHSSKPPSLCQASLEREFKALFDSSMQSYGNRRMAKGMQKKGYAMGRYQARALMKKLRLVVRMKKRFRVTTDSKHSYPVAPNKLNQQFNVSAPNQVWGTDITYLWTQQGWLYLAVVIDLFSRQVVGWALQPYLSTVLVLEALRKAFWLRKPEKGLIHHSDSGALNMATIKRYCMNLLTKDTTVKRKKHRIMAAAVDDSFRERLLFG